MNGLPDKTVSIFKNSIAAVAIVALYSIVAKDFNELRSEMHVHNTALNKIMVDMIRTVDRNTAALQKIAYLCDRE